MPLAIIIIAIVLILAAGAYNIRSLIRKMKANPGRKFDLLVGVLIWGAAMGLLIWQLFKNHI